jgi:hypothetical protein
MTFKGKCLIHTKAGVKPKSVDTKVECPSPTKPHYVKVQYFYVFLFFLFLESGSCYVAQTSNSVFSCPSLWSSWGYMYTLLHLAVTCSDVKKKKIIHLSTKLQDNLRFFVLSVILPLPMVSKAFFLKSVHGQVTIMDKVHIPFQNKVLALGKLLSCSTAFCNARCSWTRGCHSKLLNNFTVVEIGSTAKSLQTLLCISYIFWESATVTGTTRTEKSKLLHK